MWVDNLAPARAKITLHPDGLDFAIRASRWTSRCTARGLIAADRVPLDVVRRMRHTLAAGHELQRARPQPGLAGFRRCFPEVSEEHARIN